MCKDPEFYCQLSALVKKNYIIKKRNIADTVSEYLFPLIMSAIILTSTLTLNLNND